MSAASGSSVINKRSILKQGKTNAFKTIILEYENFIFPLMNALDGSLGPQLVA